MYAAIQNTILINYLSHTKRYSTRMRELDNSDILTYMTCTALSNIGSIID